MDERNLAEILRAHAARHGVPGAAVGILRAGDAMSACCGVADVSTGEPVTPETLWSAGSLAKSMVATAITLLCNADRLDVDEPVSDRVPELRRARWAARATIRDLLANRSPVPLRMDLEFGFDERRDADPGALARLVGETAALEPTAGRWSYSNVGWCALGRVIETATGRVWDDAMRELLFDPAGMGDAAFTTGPGRRARVSGHELTAAGPAPVPPLRSRAYAPAGTTLLVTMSDLLRFAAFHLEQPALASMRTLEAETAIHAWLDGWCRGWAWFDWDGGGVWGWDGLVSGERSVLRILPDRRAALALVTNSGAGRAMYRSLLPELAASELGVRMPSLRLDPVPGGAGDLARFAGTYAWPDRRVDVAAAADRLLIRRDEVESEALPLDARTFVVDAAAPDTPTVVFGALDGGGRPHMLYEMLWGLPRAGS